MVRAIGALLFFFAYPLPAQYPTPESLKVIPQVSVRVFTDHSLSSVKAKPIVHQMLTDANIAYIMDSDRLNGNPSLELSIYGNRVSMSKSIAYHVDLSLKQSAQLSRDPRIKVFATTWHNSYTNSIAQSELDEAPEVLIADIRSLLGAFIRDFKEANKPRQRLPK